jgi:ATPase subunit of ABC transporter with duplicated ATPase domains
MRAMLAQLLSSEPDILILDEPTNHLDLDARNWLSQLLTDLPEGVVFVSHDRAFIDEVADRTLELAQGRFFEAAGGYTSLLEAKRLRDERQAALRQTQSAEISRLKLVAEKQAQRAAKAVQAPKNQRERGCKPYYAAMQAKLDRRANAIRTRVAHEESHRIEKPFEARGKSLTLSTKPLRSAIAVQARCLTAGFGNRVLFTDLSFDLEPGERMAIVGPNGWRSHLGFGGSAGLSRASASRGPSGGVGSSGWRGPRASWQPGSSGQSARAADFQPFPR